MPSRQGSDRGRKGESTSSWDGCAATRKSLRPGCPVDVRKSRSSVTGPLCEQVRSPVFEIVHQGRDLFDIFRFPQKGDTGTTPARIRGTIFGLTEMMIRSSVEREGRLDIGAAGLETRRFRRGPPQGPHPSGCGPVPWPGRPAIVVRRTDRVQSGVDGDVPRASACSDTGLSKR